MSGSYVLWTLSGLIPVPGRASPNLLAASLSNCTDATLVAVGMAVGLTPLISVRDMVRAAVGARRHWGGCEVRTPGAAPGCAR